jgi:hypothetical protein
MQQLMEQGLTRDVISTRLKRDSIPAICDDFSMRQVWLVLSSPNFQAAEQVVWKLFATPPVGPSGARRFSNSVIADEAGSFARQAAESFLAGKLLELRAHWEVNAPQRNSPECDEVEWRNSLDVRSEEVQLFENEACGRSCRNACHRK